MGLFYSRCEIYLHILKETDDSYANRFWFELD